MTQPVAVVTDTTHYLPRALADMQEIHQVSLYVGWEDELERELEMSGFERFYERLRTDPEMPTTSQPSIGDFLAVWEPLIEAGRDIVSIHLASGLSGTYEAARQARGVLAERGLGDRIEVIDIEPRISHHSGHGRTSSLNWGQPERFSGQTNPREECPAYLRRSNPTGDLRHRV